MSKRRRRKSKSSHKTRRFARNPRPLRRRFRRNPIGMDIGGTVMPAAIGALGAIGVDFAMSKIPLPQSIAQNSMMIPAIKIGMAFLVGMGVSAVAGRRAGDQATAGGIVVTLYGLAANMLNQYMQQGGQQGRGQMQRYVAMRGLGNRRRRRLGAGPGRRFRRLGALPNVGVRRAGGGPVMPRRLNGLGYIGPAKTMGRYVKTR